MEPASERDRLVNEHMSLVHAIAGKLKRNLGRSLEHQDLIAYGSTGLVEAAERFDPAQGASFTTFAYYRIRGAMLDGVRAMNWYSRADFARYQAEERANAYLQANADREAAERQGAGAARDDKEDLLTEIADTLGGVATVKIVAMEAAEHVSDDSVPTADTRLIDDETSVRIRTAIESLPEKEKLMLKAFYFEGKTLLDTGAALGLSKSWASRLHTRAINLLRQKLQEQDQEQEQSPQQTQE